MEIPNHSINVLGAAAGAGQSAPSAQGAPTPSVFDLPDEPLVVIEPTRSWSPFDLRELWAYRELLYFLTWRDIKVRYKQAALGVAWVVLQPLLLTLVFTIFFGVLARVPSGSTPYALLVFVGLLPWTFFSQSVTNSSASLVGNAQLITKIYFPRLLIPAAAIAARLVDFFISLGLLSALMLYYRTPPTWSLLALPLMAALMLTLTLGVGMLASAFNVKYRDVGVITPVVVQVWMYVSPVLYPSALIPERWRTLYALNPMVGIVDGFRSALLGAPFDRYELTVSAVFSVALFVLAASLFRRTERSFADTI
jgi:lipopolysaccharide transport system permease protein